MFEFFIAKKYLIPKKNHLSASLIAALSILVISLVVWLVLLFLSITQGIEKNWLKKLTSLHGPIKIVTTDHYRRSYYHTIDQFSLGSSYKAKSLEQKLNSTHTDPYDPEQDQELPLYFPSPDRDPSGFLKDPVKCIAKALDLLKKEDASLSYDFFGSSGVLLKLKLLREDPWTHQEQHSFLTQMCFASSFSKTSSYVHALLMPPTHEDLKHLIFLSSLKPSSSCIDANYLSPPSHSDELKTRLKLLFSFVDHLEGHYSNATLLTFSDFPKSARLKVKAFYRNEKIEHFLISDTTDFFGSSSSHLIHGSLERLDHEMLFKSKDLKIKVNLATPIYLESPTDCLYYPNKIDFDTAQKLEDLCILSSGFIQGYKVEKKIPLQQATFTKLQAKTTLEDKETLSPPWIYFQNGLAQLLRDVSKDQAVLLPKHFKSAGVLIGDKGYLSYGTISPNAALEQRLPIFVAGFYDPGVLSVGARALMLDSSLVEMIAKANENIVQEEKEAHGIQVWFSDLKQTKKIAEKLEKLLEDQGVGSYFKIIPFYDFEFAKDLLIQFQSDRNLFLLIGIIILLVACSNIISFLILMINDKKKEIGIFLAMGASNQSVCLIFSLCGAFLGFIGCFLGSIAAFFTLRHIDLCVGFLSKIQGQTLLNENFYGEHLPDSLSIDALLFILFATTLLSLLAAYIPAKKASLLQPTKALRLE